MIPLTWDIQNVANEAQANPHLETLREILLNLLSPSVSLARFATE